MINLKGNRLSLHDIAFCNIGGIPALEVASRAGVADRRVVFDKTIENSKLMGLMPQDDKVVRKTLSEFGFTMQSTAVEETPADRFLSTIIDMGAPASVIADIYFPRYRETRTVGLRVHRGEYSRIYGGCTTGDVKNGVIVHIWLHWDDGVDRSPNPRRKVTRKPTQKYYDESRYIETDYYRPFQPNPCGNYVGDCVVRAIAGVMRLSWAEAVDLLATENNIVINTDAVFPKVLEKRGFICRDIEDDCRTGVALCNKLQKECRGGERVFAEVGSSHVAAIVPVSDGENGTTYKVLDSWNSSRRRLTKYWISPPEKPAEEPKRLIREDSPALSAKKKSALRVGSSIVHPSFGVGTISGESGSILTVDFESGGAHRLSEDWILEHCFVSG
ncbi:MAG: hypothetical protein LUF29_00750 [Oscillospiraceae bacterium]|nr:hypothetical protein [Oscillospiraceae bacterium]